MNSVGPKSSSVIAKQFLLTGTVQGVGMRPLVARLAGEFGLNGFVRNDSFGVEVYVEGDAQTIEMFSTRLRNAFPPAAQINQFVQRPGAVSDVSGFQIERSKITGTVTTAVPQDMAICSTCLTESFDSRSRRYKDPFATCTNCGPRYSVTKSMPFDRAATSMNAFHLCSECAREYCGATDRRFHSQTNACPTCGPQLTFMAGQTASLGFPQNSLAAAVSIIRSGGILAIKGVGGYQLICDATCTEAVQRLRKKKRRPTKPLAVMVSSIQAADELVNVSNAAKSALLSPQNPIVVLEPRPADIEANRLAKKAGFQAGLSEKHSLKCSQTRQLEKTSKLSVAINPGLSDIGLLLPTSSFHALLLDEAAVPCVVTSGNDDGDPLMFQNTEAIHTLATIADGWLCHNREIIRPIDDSVVRIIGDRQVLVRAGRGVAPLPLQISTSQKILATGGHQKVAIALSNGTQVALGPHIGDMNSVATRQRFVDHVRRFCQLYGTTPNTIAHDLHPDYFTSCWAAGQEIPTIAVQHHHAHVVSGMIEHGWLNRQVLGVCFDGTGYGTDGTIWGGEFIVCTDRAFHRVARLRPFPLIGGDSAIKQPWRIAVALLQQAGIQQSNWPAATLKLLDQSHERIQQVAHIASSSTHTMTSSMGRLFDGVASMLLNLADISFEGEAAMRLEAACDSSELATYRIPIRKEQLMELDWRPMLHEIVTDIEHATPIASIATKFTRSIANAVGQVCNRFQHLPVVLSGGCFQNAALSDLTAIALGDHKQAVGWPGIISPNDGALAVGQLAVAAALLQQTDLEEGAV